LTGQRVNDGLWHSVSLNARGLQIIMTLDSEPASTIQLTNYLELKDKHYFGGKIVCNYFQKGPKKDHFNSKYRFDICIHKNSQSQNILYETESDDKPV